MWSHAQCGASANEHLWLAVMHGGLVRYFSVTWMPYDWNMSHGTWLNLDQWWCTILVSDVTVCSEWQYVMNDSVYVGFNRDCMLHSPMYMASPCIILLPRNLLNNLTTVDCCSALGIYVYNYICHMTLQKEKGQTKMFLSHCLQNPANSDKSLQISSWIHVPQIV